MDPPTKAQRLGEVLVRLNAAPPCEDLPTMLALLSRTITEVEDELTDIPNNPAAWMRDGRLYPPQDDSIVPSPFSDCTRFRSRRHYVDIGQNGALRITDLRREEVVIDKAGHDGRKVDAK